MATYFGLVSSSGILWLQMVIFVWQAVRPAATLRVPWALISTACYKIFTKKRFDNDHFILLSTDYNDTGEAEKFCEENSSLISENKLDESSVDSSVCFQYNSTYYLCGSEKANQVRLLITAELKNVPIVKEYKVVNGFVGVWILCSADEAIRMCLQSKRFRLCFRKTVSFCLIEHMPLITDTYWLSKVLGGVPLYLTAKGDEKLASIATLSLIILDFTYNVWVPLVEHAYLMFVRILQLILSNLSANLRFLVFYFLSNFDNKYLPCSISDFKVKIKKTGVFYTTDNTVPNCRVKSLGQERFEEVDISKDTFDFQTRAFTLHIEKKKGEETNNLVKFELKLRGVLYNRVRAEYSMRREDFITYIGCLQLLRDGHIGLVQTVDDGFVKNMHLFGFEETINLFWGGNVKVYRVELEKEDYYLMAGENKKCAVNFKMEELWGSWLVSTAFFSTRM